MFSSLTSPRYLVVSCRFFKLRTSREGFLIIYSREAVSGSLDHAGLLTRGLFQDLLPGGDFEEPYHRLARLFFVRMKACTPETVKPTHSVNDEGVVWSVCPGQPGVAKDDSPLEPEP